MTRVNGSVPAAAPRLSAEEAVARACELAPRFRERADDTERLRRLTDETIADISASGLFGIATPMRWGGSELAPEVWIDVITQLAAACGSTGWVYGVLLGHNWLVSQFSQEAQQEVFGNPEALVASLVRLGGSAPERVPGGFRWRGAAGRFCSGVDFAEWVVVGGAVESPDGLPEMRWFLIPRSDFVVDDDWFTTGLRGTGSKSIRVADAFIPDYRSITAQSIDDGTAPGRSVNSGPLYRLPGGTFAFVLPAAPVGIARGAVDIVGSGLQHRLQVFDDERIAEHSATIARFGKAASAIDVAYVLLIQRARRLMQTADQSYTPLERTQHRRDTAYAAQHARHAINELMELSGGSGIYESTMVQRMWRDCNAAAAHFGLTWETAATAYGRTLLGLGPAKSDRMARQ
jgi:alkylation response protein AidB-like acyl-CoA dehydrogenase